MLEFKIQQSEHNHYIKKTILENWLINNKYYYFDIKNNSVAELGKRQSNKQFTSLLISKSVEDYVKTNNIENNFENAVSSYIKHYDFIDPKKISKIPTEKLDEIKNPKIQNVFNTCVDYIALQITRNPNNTYKYFPDFKKGLESQSIMFQFFPKESQDLLLSIGYKAIFDNDSSTYPTLFNIHKSKIKQPHEFYFIKSKHKIFHLSENNTCSLFELLEKSNLKSQELSDDLLNNAYVTVLSPNLLLLINCNEDMFSNESVQPIVNNIEYLWTHFVINDTLGKIILSNKDDITIQNIKDVIDKKEIKLQNLYNNFNTNESIYKKYLL